MSTSFLSKFKRYIWDVVLIAVIAVSSLSFIIFPNVFSKDGSIARISSCNENVLNVSLNISSTYKVEGKYSIVEIEVKDGAIRILDNDCPTQFCVHEGWISKSGETLVCAYNQVVVQILGGSEDADVTV